MVLVNHFPCTRVQLLGTVCRNEHDCNGLEEWSNGGRLCVCVLFVGINMIIGGDRILQVLVALACN